MEERMMRRVADSAVIQTQLVLNSHLNGAGRLFGGQLMEWIDVVATVVARRHAHCNPTTASVDNLQFKEAVHLNNTLIIEGKLTYVGRTSMEVRVDTFVESLSGARKLVNTAYVVMVALDENEHPMEVPGLHLENPRLWWPNGYGDQAMYDLDLRVKCGGAESDVRRVRFGVREFSYELTADTPRGEEIRFEFQPTNDVRDGEPLFDTFHRRVVQQDVVVPALREGVDVSRLRRIGKDATSPYLVLRCNGVRIFCRGGN